MHWQCPKENVFFSFMSSLICLFICLFVILYLSVCDLVDPFQAAHLRRLLIFLLPLCSRSHLNLVRRLQSISSILSITIIRMKCRVVVLNDHQPLCFRLYCIVVWVCLRQSVALKKYILLQSMFLMCIIPRYCMLKYGLM